MRMLYCGCATKLNIKRGAKVQEIANEGMKLVEEKGYEVRDVKIEDFENALHIWILYE